MSTRVKSLSIGILGLLYFQTTFAQKKDTVAYYLQNSGKEVSTKDSADFILAIFPPDASVDKNLFTVKEFYKNGTTKLVGKSRTNDLNLKFQGSQISFFPNGRRMRIAQFEQGEPAGDIICYYPNGKLYNIKRYVKDKKIFLKQFNDSTGNVLAENGKGKWIEYNENFSAINAEGEVSHGLQDGKWHGRINDSVDFDMEFDKGKIISSATFYKYMQPADTYTKVDTGPEFKGGIYEFSKFLARNVRYPVSARESSIQGRVITGFVIEKDGSVSNVKTIRGIGGGCDEEAIRVIKLSPPWKPGVLNGKLVRVACTVPIAFSIDVK